MGHFHLALFHPRKIKTTIPFTQLTWWYTAGVLSTGCVCDCVFRACTIQGWKNYNDNEMTITGQVEQWQAVSYLSRLEKEGQPLKHQGFRRSVCVCSSFGSLCFSCHQWCPQDTSWHGFFFVEIILWPSHNANYNDMLNHCKGNEPLKWFIIMSTTLILE